LFIIADLSALRSIGHYGLFPDFRRRCIAAPKTPLVERFVKPGNCAFAAKTWKARKFALDLHSSKRPVPASVWIAKKDLSADKRPH